LGAWKQGFFLKFKTLKNPQRKSVGSREANFRGLRERIQGQSATTMLSEAKERIGVYLRDWKESHK
jgi:hypothetical protein